MNSAEKTLIVVGGPTAVGKTQICIQMAQQLKTVILSADSRQLYQELTIGSAKPTVEELQMVPHHFINHRHLDQPYNAGKFEQEALHVLEQHFKNHDTAILTGGTGLYIDALCKGIDQMPDIDPDVRAKIDLQYKTHGISFLQEQLSSKDPAYAQEVDMSNPRRLTRALEVIEQTGQTFSSYRKQSFVPRNFNIKYILMMREKSDLHHRINQRVDRMIEQGLLQETLGLEQYWHLPVMRTVGYSEMIQFAKKEITFDRAIELIKQSTRQYAKRQITWFKKDDKWTVTMYN